MLSDLSVNKMVTANLALWRPLELLRANACDPAVPSREPTVPPPVPAVPPRDPHEPRDESRAYTRGGLPVGWCSREFSTQELLAYTCPKEPMIVFIEARDSSAAAVCARLAGSVPGAALRLERAAPCRVSTSAPCRVSTSAPCRVSTSAPCRVSTSAPCRLSLSTPCRPSPGALTEPPATWRVRCVSPAPPGELRLWFDHDLLHLFRIPYLSLDNIIHSSRYECGTCGAVFAEPNPLKVHAALRCADGTAAAGRRQLWARAASTAAGTVGSPLPACPATAERVAAALGSRGARGVHACVYCGRVYSRRYGLRIHVRTHTGWRPLRCAVCRRAFADPSNLNKHAKLHRLRGDTVPPPPPTTSPPTQR